MYLGIYKKKQRPLSQRSLLFFSSEARMGLAVASATSVAGFGLGLHRGVVGFLERHVLDEGLGDHELLHDLALLVDGLTDHDALALGGEDHAADGDVLGAAVVPRGGSDAREAHLEDADAVEAHLLSEFEEVLHGAAQLVEHGLDVALLDRSLGLDEVGQLLGLDEVLIVDRRGKPLAVGRRLVVLVLNFLKFLTHNLVLSFSWY